MVSISFTQPWFLFFLLVLPVFIFIHLVTLRTTKASALRFANFEAIARIRGIDFFSRSIVILILSMIIALLVILPLSGLRVNTVTDASTFSFVLAIDTSRSMGATDILPTRIEAAKKAALEFVDTTPLATKVGVVSFSGTSFIEQDLTDIKSLARGGINDIELGNVGGTDLFEAVVTSSNLLKAEETKAIVLLSDGQINVGSLESVIDYANENNVVVHTIAVGTVEGGEASFGLSKVDEDSLKALAFNTDGEFFTATNEEELSESFKNAIVTTERKVSLNINQYLLIAAVILFALEYFLINTRYKRIP